MGQLAQPGEPAATEVQAVDVDPRRGMGQRQSTQDGTEQGGLAALRAADHGHVSGAARQGQPQQVTALLVRLVDQRHRYLQRPAQLRVGHGEPECRLGDQRTEQLVQPDRLLQRR